MTSSSPEGVHARLARRDSRQSSAAEAPLDPLLAEIADYAVAQPDFGPVAYTAATLCLMDSLGCALLALSYPACAPLIGPVVPEATLPGGARVPGTDLELDPVQAAFSLGALIRWLDFNDTWLAAEWGHPSDNIGGILAAADYLSRERFRGPSFEFRVSSSESRVQRAGTRNPEPGTQRPRVRDVLTAIIRAHEIQGVLALENSFNRLGLDHVILVRVATAAAVTALLGGSREQVIAAVSNAWVDGGSLRVYRHDVNTGRRKSWAAGDATSRGVWLALMALKGEPGYPTALSAPTWGFHDVLNRGRPLTLARPLASYVIENVLFKVGYPAEFHGQTAVEAAIRLHPMVRDRLDRIERIRIETQESAVRIIDKRGPLRNPADRDHCIQYMVAVGLIRGALTADDYEDVAAADPRIDRLRQAMEVVENPAYSRDYLDPSKRSVANAVGVTFKDGSQTPPVEIDYPLGHPRRREEARPLLWAKFETNLATRLPPARVAAILQRFRDPVRLAESPVDELVDLFIPQEWDEQA